MGSSLQSLLNNSSEILSPKVDFVFKLLFGSEKNKPILTQFLQAVLDIPHDDYETISLQNPILSKNFADDKFGILDVKLKTKSGKLINIEIQVLDVPNYVSRLLFYVSKMVNEQIKNGQNYSVINKTISISILNFNLIEDTSSYHNKYHLYDTQSKSKLTDLVEIITLELPKLPKDTDNNPIFPWMKFIDSKDKEEAMQTVTSYPELTNAYQELQTLSLDEENRELYEQRLKWYLDEINMREGSFTQGLEQGMQQGLEKGISQGERQKAFEDAYNLKQLGVSAKIISQATGLSLDEVEKL